MLDASLDAISAVSGPAVLMNASALLLAAATGRYQLAMEAAPQPDDGSSKALRRQVTISAAAVHSLHVALMAFGVECALLFVMAADVEAVRAPGPVLRSIGSLLSIAGLSGMAGGVVLLAIEGVFGFCTMRLPP